jgi:hypothetical protein
LPQLCSLNHLRSSIRTMADPVFDNAQALHAATHEGWFERGENQHASPTVRQPTKGLAAKIL